MKKWMELIIHAFFWLTTAWLIASNFSIQSHEIEVIDGTERIKIIRNSGVAYQLLLCVFFSLLAFYCNAWLLMKRNREGNKKRLNWSVLLIFAILSVLIYALTEIHLLKDVAPIPKQTAFGVAAFYFSISLTYALTKNSVFNEQRHRELIIDKTQAELNLLRNQLQPHFLFNALNNLLSMVNRFENPKLVSSIDKLSQLLRFVIEDNRAEKISISKEIQFLKNYIDLQMLRFEDGEVNVEFNVIGDNYQHNIEPGLFIPFVENAFKYGTEPENRSNIAIQFDLSEIDSIRFEIKNKIMLTKIDSIGTGIKSTRKRLELVYPDKHKLNISNADDFIVQLSIYTQ